MAICGVTVEFCSITSINQTGAKYVRAFMITFCSISSLVVLAYSLGLDSTSSGLGSPTYSIVPFMFLFFNADMDEVGE